MRTMDAECGDEDLRDALRTVLNTREYADKVASQLYHEQWTLASLQSISPSRLEDVLRHMRVFLSFSSTPRFPPPPLRSPSSFFSISQGDDPNKNESVHTRT